jgi:predicted MFS family arabinose efflux permease
MRDSTSSGDAVQGSELPAAGASPGYANYVLGVLFVVYVFNFIDRQAMSVFIGPIQQEFGASDTVMGLLVGFAFALLYTVAGIPIARLADRGNRRTIVAVGLAVWSAMTIASGMARTFTQLVLARIGVGIGEAAGTPPSHSLIADYFAPNRRATALAIYSSGVFVGSAIAYLGGGFLREHFDWRTAFIVLGAPGLAIALLVRFTVREPPRGLSEQRSVDTAQSSLGETLRYLLDSRAWRHLIIGSALLSITGYGVLMWGYEFYGRVHGMGPFAVGQWMALIVGVGGSLGTLIGGRLADKLGERRPSLALSVPGLVTLCAMPIGALFLLTEWRLLSLWGFFVFYLFLNAYIPTMYSANQNLARLEMRATTSAILLFIINIVGAGVGPFLVGLLNDHFAATYGTEAIRYGLASTLLAGAVGALFFVLSSRHVERDLQRAGLDGHASAMTDRL